MCDNVYCQKKRETPVVNVGNILKTNNFLSLSSIYKKYVGNINIGNTVKAHLHRLNIAFNVVRTEHIEKLKFKCT